MAKTHIYIPGFTFNTVLLLVPVQVDGSKFGSRLCLL